MKKCKAERGVCWGCRLKAPLVVCVGTEKYCAVCAALLIRFVKEAA